MTTATAWDLLFAVPDGVAFHPQQEAIAPRPERAADGWAGPDGPGVEWRHWPRSSHTGMPMMHVLTLRLPAAYRRQGPECPGIAFFAGEGDLALDRAPAVGDPLSPDPFLADLGEAVEHPGLRRRRDYSGDEFAILWMTAEELEAGPTPCGPDTREPETHFDFSDGSNGWVDFDEEHREIWLIERPDPNAGLAPRDDPWESHDVTDADGYTWRSNGVASWSPWAAPLEGRSHLGGTSFPRQEVVPDGLTPWYLELDDVANAYLGDSTVHIDLDSETFDIQFD